MSNLELPSAAQLMRTTLARLPYRTIAKLTLRPTLAASGTVLRLTTGVGVKIDLRRDRDGKITQMNYWLSRPVDVPVRFVADALVKAATDTVPPPSADEVTISDGGRKVAITPPDNTRLTVTFEAKPKGAHKSELRASGIVTHNESALLPWLVLQLMGDITTKAARQADRQLTA